MFFEWSHFCIEIFTNFRKGHPFVKKILSAPLETTIRANYAVKVSNVGCIFTGSIA